MLIVAGAMSLLNTATTLLLTATPVTIGVVEAGTVEVTVGGEPGEPGEPGTAVAPPTPNTGSCPPQAAVSTAISEAASQVEQRE